MEIILKDFFKKRETSIHGNVLIRRTVKNNYIFPSIEDINFREVDKSFLLLLVEYLKKNDYPWNNYVITIAVWRDGKWKFLSVPICHNFGRLTRVPVIF